MAPNKRFALRIYDLNRLEDYLPTSQEALAEWMNNWGQLICPSGSYDNGDERHLGHSREYLEGREKLYTTALLDTLARASDAPVSKRIARKQFFHPIKMKGLEIWGAFTDDRPEEVRAKYLSDGTSLPTTSINDRLMLYSISNDIPEIHKADVTHEYEHAAWSLTYLFDKLRLVCDPKYKTWQSIQESTALIRQSETKEFKTQNYRDYANFLEELYNASPPELTDRQQLIIQSKKIQKALKDEIEIDNYAYDQIEKLCSGAIKAIRELGDGHPALELVENMYKRPEIKNLENASSAWEALNEMNISKVFGDIASLFPEDDPARKILKVALDEFPCRASRKNFGIDQSIEQLAVRARELKDQVWAIGPK